MDNYNRISRVGIFNFTIVCEGVLLLIVALWANWAEYPLIESFRLNWRIALLGIGAGLLTVFCAFGTVAASGRSPKTGWLHDTHKIMFEEIGPLFTQLNLIDILLISAASGLCEEAFYRGMLQNIMGLPLASAVFGIMHCPNLRMGVYALITFFAGLFLGWLYQYTGSLWAPIFAHALNNLIVMLYFRYRKNGTGENAQS